MHPTEWRDVLGPALAEALEERKFEALTEVQLAVLAPNLAGRDLRISSQTGSGKTVAMGFVLRRVFEAPDEAPAPADQQGPARTRVAARPRALVIVPTRELATQVKDELGWLYARTQTRVTAVLGGAAYRDELRALARRPALVVGTPGRLKDHLERGAIDASGVRAVVLDEADRMLDMGFRDDIEAILGLTPSERQTHLVSATFPPEVRALADRVQRDPARVEGTPLGEANRDIEHLVHLVREEERVAAIVNLVLATPEAPTLVFVRRRADVMSLAEDLREAGFRTGTLSGEMEQRDRERTLGAFRRGALDVLVATDVAARGLDVQGVGRVVHAEPPDDPDAYTHRSGRTGRAGQKGTSSILVGPRGLARLMLLLRRARVLHRFSPVPTQDEIRAERSDRLFEALTEDRDEETRSAGVLGDVPSTIDRDDETLAIRLEKSGRTTRALVRLLAIGRRTFASAEPRAITPIQPPAEPVKPAPMRRRGRYEEAEASFPHSNGGFVPRPNAPRTIPPEAAPAGPRPPRPQEVRRFRITWGEAHGATARRLVAMLCRRGGIESKDIGTIQVHRIYATVDIAAGVAEAFASKVGVPDPRDPRVTVRPELEAASAVPAARKSEARPKAPPPKKPRRT